MYIAKHVWMGSSTENLNTAHGFIVHNLCGGSALRSFLVNLFFMAQQFMNFLLDFHDKNY